jgi:hypothetical protein
MPEEMTERRTCGKCRLWTISWPRLGFCPFSYDHDQTNRSTGPLHKCHLSDKTFNRRVADWDDQYSRTQELKDISLCYHNDFKKGCLLGLTEEGEICRSKWKPEGELVAKICPYFTAVRYKIVGKKIQRIEWRPERD